METSQQSLATIEPSFSLQRKTTAMDLLEIALSKDAAIDVIERLAALQREERDYQAKVSFDSALNRCQAKLGRVSADLTNDQTHSKYASYAQLDRIIRPVYTAEGFSISFGERDCPVPGRTRFVAYVSRSGVTREYIKDMSPSTKGPKGNDVMTPIHADGAADSYAKRYLLKDIFNIAIGEDDTDGNPIDMGSLNERLEWIANCRDLEELHKVSNEAYKFFKNSINAQKAIVSAKDKRKRELQ